ncbi:Cytochrome monooxygenase xanG [Penicillium argentinense]|uniref:Cytochrome monooxygenase xanG n=1 Tax=Penicillium argentinense TaxID=1131581 RepID=A0A9W9G045_9EURO|nr:Cytochrome monooxygenase xanG [Penicillium argentinense]KAJ5109624.1 Cytochrome monooxygenase xanG [Penicillium argentinense]
MDWSPFLTNTWARIALTILSSLLLLVYWYIRIPSDMPKNIPSVPIYISIMGLWSDMGQTDIYDKWLREPLEKHGAVTYWAAGRWNVLATRPRYLVDMFRHEDVYAKAGSQKKIPWSVIASLVGGNIINSHGELWKLFTSIMKPGLQRRITDSMPLLLKSRLFVDCILAEQGRLGESGVLVNPFIQRWALSCMGLNFMNVDLESLEKPNQRLEQLQTLIKKTLFEPLFFNFPDLDRYPTIFRRRKVAFSIMQEFGDLLVATVRARPRNEDKDGSQVVDALDAALNSGLITEEQYRANLKVTFLTAHENAQQLLNSAFWVLGSNTSIQDKLRAEILATKTTNPTSDEVNALPYLYAVIVELLRLYPPVSQLVNRVTMSKTVLGGDIVIPNHTWVGWNAFGIRQSGALMQGSLDLSGGGSDVKTIHGRVRSKTVACHFIAFNAHSRKCLGQGFAVLQMKILLFEMVRRVQWVIDPEYELKLTSGGIMAPLNLRAIVTEREAEPRATTATTPVTVMETAAITGTAGDSEKVFPLVVVN